MGIDFSAARQSYEKDMLVEHALPAVPYPLIELWVSEAIKKEVHEPYAMSLATCGADGRPSVRTVLMRELKETAGELSLVFYTNYDSVKGVDLAENPFAEALFFWATLERQLRLSGRVEKLSSERSAAYFHSRPKDSQLAAWVSRPQSGTVESRERMQAEFDALEKQFPDTVPLPEFWGGYRIVIDKVEFWQGRANRMHDRICYEKAGDDWQRQRLLP